MSKGTRLTVRMMAPLIGVSVLLLTLGSVAAWYVHELQDTSSDLLVVNVGSVRAAEELEIGLREVRTLLNKFLRTRDPAKLTECAQLRRETERWLIEAETLSTTARETELMSAARQGYERFFREFDRLSRDANDGTVEESPEVVEHLIDEVLTREVLEPVHAYLDFNEEWMAKTSRRNQAVTDWMVVVLLLLGTSGALSGVIAGFGISRHLNRSIVQLTVPIRNAAGRLNEVVGPVTVVTGKSLDELEETLRHVGDRVSDVVERLQQSERETMRAEQLAAVGQLAAGVAHELRNPLMSMKLLVQTAIETGDEARLEGRDLRVLDDVVRRVERSVQSLLEFARPPSLQMAQFDASEVVRQTVELVQPRAEQQNVRIECDLAEPSPLCADQGQVRQLVLNLLLNALDAVPPGGHVGVKLRFDSAESFSFNSSAVLTSSRQNLAAQQQPTGIVTLAVLDNGSGLPKNCGDRIFDPFFSTKETGTGLGLSICRRIVDAHGGDIRAASRTSGGAEFVVKLPVVQPVGVKS